MSLSKKNIKKKKTVGYGGGDGNGTQTFQIKKRENISDCANL
jgi:hypothetical protein